MDHGSTGDMSAPAWQQLCIRVATSLVVLMALPGCIAQRAVQSVDSPAKLEILASSYTAAQKKLDEGKYDRLVRSKDLEGAKAKRDVIVHSVRKEIEVVYQAFESGLFAKKAAFEIETDIFELLVSTATTLTGAERARTNLSALLTATKGSRLSVDKNVFAEKTYGALVSQMRASRSKVNEKILLSLSLLDVAKYPLAEAELDLVQLFNAGTLHEALTQISAQAGANAKDEAQKEGRAARTNIRQLQLYSPTEVDETKRITDALGSSQFDLPKATIALQALGHDQTKMPKTADEAKELLRQYLRRAQPGADMAKIIDAFKSAGLIN